MNTENAFRNRVEAGCYSQRLTRLASPFVMPLGSPGRPQFYISDQPDSSCVQHTLRLLVKKSRDIQLDLNSG